MNRPSILLVGTDRYVLDACRRRDLDVVLLRGYHSLDAGQVEVPDGVTVLPVEDQRNPESVLAALARAGLDGTSIDAVQTTNEQSLVTAATLATLFGCPSPTPRTAVLFRDKWLQKEVVRRAGVPAARSTFVSDVRGALPELPYPRAVLKPAAGAATAHTAVVSSTAELRTRAAEFGRSATRQYVLEEFVSGDEYVADGVVRDGVVQFVALGRYGSPCIDAIDRGAPQRLSRLDPVDDADSYDLADPVVRAAIGALGLRNGVFHMELFYDGARVVFSECAARRGGGMIQEEVKRKFGVDLADTAVALALGDEPALDVVRRPEAVGSTFLTGPSGVLVSSATAAELRDRPGVEFARVEIPRGAVVPGKASDTNTRVGMALVTAASAGELDARMDDLVNWFAGSCSVLPADVSVGGLRHWQRETWPEIDFDGGLFTPAPLAVALG